MEKPHENFIQVVFLFLSPFLSKDKLKNKK
jgi:hypothetical protein